MQEQPVLGTPVQTGEKLARHRIGEQWSSPVCTHTAALADSASAKEKRGAERRRQQHPSFVSPAAKLARGRDEFPGASIEWQHCRRRECHLHERGQPTDYLYLGAGRRDDGGERHDQIAEVVRRANDERPPPRITHGWRSSRPLSARGRKRRRHSTCSTARNASWGISTAPTCFMRFFPSFCFSRSLRFRVMSPP